MPPKKKARVPLQAAATPTNIARAPTDEPPEPMEIDSPEEEEIALDPWTDEQETSLFKSMIKWKPVGMHKHFRMIAISENLRNHGYTSARDSHTRIPGIWEKLHSLYDLEALDQRENDVGNLDLSGDDHMHEPFFEFGLPKDEYGKMMDARRLAPDGSQSPSASSNPIPSGRSSRNRRYSTIDDTDDPRSSPNTASGHASIRSSRNKPTGKSQLQSVSVPVSKHRKGKVLTGQEKSPQDDGEEDELGDMGGGTPASTAKGTQKVSKAAKSNSSRRKSVRKR